MSAVSMAIVVPLIRDKLYVFLLRSVFLHYSVISLFIAIHESDPDGVKLFRSGKLDPNVVVISIYGTQLHTGGKTQKTQKI